MESVVCLSSQCSNADLCVSVSLSEVSAVMRNYNRKLLLWGAAPLCFLSLWKIKAEIKAEPQESGKRNQSINGQIIKIYH